MSDLELYGTARCLYTREIREWLEWAGRDFIEYDVEIDAAARHRLFSFGGQRTVPVLIEAGKIVQVGWQGHGCIVSAEPAE